MELKSASCLLKEKNESFCSTSCLALDEILGGGIPFGCITQIAGESGSGKTQFCFQLCLNIQNLSLFGDLAGEVVYLDTENTFNTERLLEIAKGITNHQQNLPTATNVNDYFAGIYLFHCVDIIQLLAATHQMFAFIELHHKVKLIIIDSLAQCLRHNEDMKARMKFLNSIADNLRRLAVHYNVAVVVINQVTTKFCAGGQSVVVPALGYIWSNIPSTKIMLLKFKNQVNDIERIALLYKSSTKPRAMVHFSVTSYGIDDDKKASTTPFLLTQEITEELLYNEFDQILSSQSSIETVHWSSSQHPINLESDIKSCSVVENNQLSSVATDLIVERSLSPVLSHPSKRKKLKY